jgi:hypothetical protein
MLQCFAGRTLILLAPLLFLFELFQFLGCVWKGWLGVWFKAAGWMLSHARITAAARRRVQLTRRVSDRAILRGGDIPFSRGLAQSRLERGACAMFNWLSRAYWRLIQNLL